MHILVTNDDGIDSLGLHHLAVAMLPFGDVTIVAPDSEYSGASASFGALNQIRPEVHRLHLAGDGPLHGLDRVTAYSVSGPPALCVFFARMGVFGFTPDLVVSGINPGANVGRVVYHSGTVGAALTARNGGISGIAVSQDVPNGSVDGQGQDDMLAEQKWPSAAKVAADVVAGWIAAPPHHAVVLNVNVPNLAYDDMRGWRATSVGSIPPRTIVSAALEPKPGHTDAFRVAMTYGPTVVLDPTEDGGAVTAGYVSVTSLTRLIAGDLDSALVAHLDHTIGRG